MGVDGRAFQLPEITGAARANLKRHLRILSPQELEVIKNREGIVGAYAFTELENRRKGKQKKEYKPETELLSAGSSPLDKIRPILATGIAAGLSVGIALHGRNQETDIPQIPETPESSAPLLENGITQEQTDAINKMKLDGKPLSSPDKEFMVKAVRKLMSLKSYAEANAFGWTFSLLS